MEIEDEKDSSQTSSVDYEPLKPSSQENLQIFNNSNRSYGQLAPIFNSYGPSPVSLTGKEAGDAVSHIVTKSARNFSSPHFPAKNLSIANFRGNSFFSIFLM